MIDGVVDAFHQWGEVAISLGVRKETRTMVAGHLDRLLKANRALLAGS